MTTRVSNSANADLDFDGQLADELAKFYSDPLAHVMFSYPWDTDRSIQLVKLPAKYQDRFNCVFGPDVWACEFLDDVGADVRARKFDGMHAVDPIAHTTASGHGIGKSVLVAWIIKWIADTRPFSRGVVTATTAEQLRTKTWATLGHWHKLSMTSHWFDFNTGRGAMSLSHKEHKETWRCDAQTSREENSESFAGLHAANSTPYYVFDEASGVPDKIFDVREGGTTDGEPMIFDFGNPTKNSGRFYENCIGKFKHRYKVHSIDSRSVAITNKKRIQQWVDDYGEDSDFVKVRVRGIFPSAGSTQFIGTDDVDTAMGREDFQDYRDPLVIGVDIAGMGGDETIIYPRLGVDARTYAPNSTRGRYMGLDTMEIVDKVIETVQFFRRMGKKPAAIFIDLGNMGAGVVDRLRQLGYDVIGINFGNSSADPTYRFRADEMWGKMRLAIKNSLILPARYTKTGNDLRDQLTQREYGFTVVGNKISLESKRDMRGRGLSSPDLGDGLALTYAQDVNDELPDTLGEHKTQEAVSEYDPHNTQEFAE